MTAPSDPSTRRLRTVSSAVTALVIFAAVALAWSNSLSVPFHFDDHASILDNASIRRLWPPDWLRPPATAGETVSGRPVLNFTFAVNHALGGLDPRGYHLLNLLIHAGAALTLWGILRRTPAAGGPGVALAAALLWSVHPVQTAAVTYVAQRAESLAGLFSLLTLYGFIRGAAGAGRGWFVVATVCCLLGAGTKETAAVVPLIVLLYDRAFLTGGFGAAWRARGRVHAALLATWLPLTLLVWVNHARGGSAGTGTIGAGTYLLTQCDAIVRYLGLTFWPAGQVFDYGAPVIADFGTVAPQFLLLAALAAGSLWLLRRNRPAGFAGACFFLLLAPSSSIMPVGTQTMAEHRMYLALAVPVVLVTAVVGSRGHGRAAVWVGAAGVIALGAATFARNRVYRSELTLWQDTVARRPDNPRAHHNLGLALEGAGRPEEAAAEFRRTLALQPNHAFAHFALGKAALLAGRWSEAADGFGAALTADPRYVDARVNLARALTQLGRKDEALTQYRQALADEPGAADIRISLAELLVQTGSVREGETLLREALAIAPGLPEAHYQLGLALAKSGGAAEGEFQHAVRLKPTFAAAHLALGNARAGRGDLPGADASYQEALRVEPGLAEAHFARGNLRARQQRFAEAIDAYRETLILDPAHIRARANLGNCQLVTGRIEEAIATYEQVLQARPDDTVVRQNLELAREQAGRRR